MHLVRQRRAAAEFPLAQFSALQGYTLLKVGRAQLVALLGTSCFLKAHQAPLDRFPIPLASPLSIETHLELKELVLASYLS